MRRIAYLFLAAISLLVAAASPIAAETRPHYGGTLRVMMQAAPGGLELPTNAANAANITAADYWDIARTLSLIGDTLVTLDAQDRPRPRSPSSGTMTTASDIGNSRCATE